MPILSGPSWLSWPFASLMIILALCHAGRLVAARRRGRTGGYDVDLTHLVLCTAMAAMLVTTFGAPFAAAWSIVIGVPTLWFVLRALRALTPGGTLTSGRTLTSGGALISDRARALTQPMQQAFMCAAMLYMLAATSSSSPAVDGHVGHDLAAATSMPMSSLVLAGILGVGIIGVAAARHTGQPRIERLLLAPGLSLGSQLAMSGTMVYMLAIMA